MRPFPALLGLLLASAPARAETFWLAAPQDAAAAEPGSAPPTLRGVLLAEEDGVYVIRVVGGSVRIPKSLVFRVDEDDWTMATVAAAEAAAAPAGLLANQQRRQEQSALRATRQKVAQGRASARRRGRAVEASATVAKPRVERFDPVLGVAASGDQLRQRMDAAERDWQRTRNRRYLKLLRQLRRAR